MSENLLTRLKKWLGHYVDVRVIFVIDVIISFVASIIVLLVYDLMSPAVNLDQKFFTWWTLTMLIATIVLRLGSACSSIVLRLFFPLFLKNRL